jgi:hypothetical protein
VAEISLQGCTMTEKGIPEKFKDTYGVLQLLATGAPQKHSRLLSFLKKLKTKIQENLDNIFPLKNYYSFEDPYEIYCEIFWEINYFY